MSTRRRAVIPFAAIALAALMAPAGCVFVAGNSFSEGPDAERWYVDEAGMTSLVNTNKSLRLGMTRDEAIALYPARFTTLMSSSTIADRHVEEWRVDAYEGTRRNVRAHFRRWLYFADGRLVRFGEERFDYLNHPDVVANW